MRKEDKKRESKNNGYKLRFKNNLSSDILQAKWAFHLYWTKLVIKES